MKTLKKRKIMEYRNIYNYKDFFKNNTLNEGLLGKTYKLFENQNKRLRIGDEIFFHFDDGVEFEEFLESYDNKTINYDFLYEINEFKIMVLDDIELYLLYQDYIVKLNNAFYGIFQSFFTFAEQQDKKLFMKRMNDYSDILIVYKKFLYKTLDYVKKTSEYKDYKKNIEINRFKI